MGRARLEIGVHRGLLTSYFHYWEASTQYVLHIRQVGTLVAMKHKSALVRHAWYVSL